MANTIWVSLLQPSMRDALDIQLGWEQSSIAWGSNGACSTADWETSNVTMDVLLSFEFLAGTEYQGRRIRGFRAKLRASAGSTAWVGLTTTSPYLPGIFLYRQTVFHTEAEAVLASPWVIDYGSPIELFSAHLGYDIEVYTRSTLCLSELELEIDAPEASCRWHRHRFTAEEC